MYIFVKPNSQEIKTLRNKIYNFKNIKNHKIKKLKFVEFQTKIEAYIK